MGTAVSTNTGPLDASKNSNDEEMSKTRCGYTITFEKSWKSVSNYTLSKIALILTNKAQCQAAPEFL